MNLKFKYTTSFSSKVKVITPTEYCEQLSVASLSDLNKLFATSGIDIEGNPDLLLNGFNAAVANRINANDDGISGADALAHSSKFIHKFTDIEHDRTRIIGHIVSQAFSSFGDNKIVDSESLASTKAAFNIALGAVVYRAVDEDFANLLIESSDESSSRYNAISTSWELGFNDYHILVGHRDFDKGDLITDPVQIKELSKNLRAYGGTGKTKDNENVYRVIVGGLPLGIGYTTTPAADVEGVLVVEEATATEKEREVIDLGVSKSAEAAASSLENTIFELNLSELAKKLPNTFEEVAECANAFARLGLETEEILKRTSEALILSRSAGIKAVAAVESLKAAAEVFQKNENKISQTQTQTVKNNSIMEIKKLSDITDDSLKQASASSVTDFIKKEIEKSNEQYVADLEKKKDEAKSLATELEVLKENVLKATEAQEKSDKEIKLLKEAAASELADRLFNERMASLNEQYTLSEKASEVVAKQIRGLDEEAFKTWFDGFEALYASNKKEVKKEEAKASTTTETAETVLENVKEQKSATVPNATVATTEGSPYEKYQDAFSGESILISRR